MHQSAKEDVGTREGGGGDAKAERRLGLRHQRWKTSTGGRDAGWSYGKEQLK